MIFNRKLICGGTRGFHVLGIETSFDDTGVAIIRQDGKILSNCIDSQLKKHLQHGGIIPAVAKDYHLSNIDRVANEAFRESKLDSVAGDLNAIAVTTRPGLQNSLKVGLNYARKLAKKYSKPLIPIHHMQAHSLMPLMQHNSIRFPFLTLLISGGHCLLAVASRYNKFDVLGESRDEAPGDLLDKISRRLKLRNLGDPFDSISGGASIELLASTAGANRFKYFSTVPMNTAYGCDFSFSGYRGSFDDLCPLIDELWMSGNREALISELSHLCASLQRVILIQMAKKIQRAYLFYRMHWRYSNEKAFYSDIQPKHLGYDLLKIDDDQSTIDLVVSGGVAANSYITNGLKLACEECIDSQMKVYAPTKELCSDNGLMIAWNGLLRYRDYIENKDSFDSQMLALDDSVLEDEKKMDMVEVNALAIMGRDLREIVTTTSPDRLRLKHPEFKLLR